MVMKPTKKKMLNVCNDVGGCCLLLWSLIPELLICSDTHRSEKQRHPAGIQTGPQKKKGSETGSQRTRQYSENNIEQNAMMGLLSSGKF